MPNIIIAGGGIAGLTLASALSRKGRAVTVLEARQREDTRGGAALAMAPNAVWVLRRLGLADAVTAAGTRITRYAFRRESGAELKTVTFQPLEAVWHESAWCVPRAHILEVLASTLPPEALRPEAPLETVRWNGRGFDLSGPFGRLSADLLVGADGAHSIVREQLWPPAPPQYQGFVAVRGVLAHRLLPSQQDTAVQTWGAHGEFGYSAMGPDAVYWFATFRWADPETLPDWTAVLTEMAPWGSLASEFAHRTPSTARLIHPIYDRVVPFADLGIPCTLIGDAAHWMTPNTGQGACQGILDAWVLAEQLVQTSDVRTALSRYREIRLKRALRVARLSHMLGRIIHDPRHWPQNLVARLLPWTPSTVIQRAMAEAVGSPGQLGLE